MAEGGVAGLDVNDMEPPRVAHQGGGHLAVRGAQRVRQFANAEQGEFDWPLSPVMLDGAREAIKVGQPAFQLGRLDLQEPLDRQRIKLPLPGQQLLPDQVSLVLGSELPAFHRRLFRHLHRQVFPENPRRAGQDIAFRHGGIGQRAEAARIHLAAGNPDKALAAGAFAAAGGFDFHPRLPGRIEQPRLRQDLDSTTGGLEFNLGHE